jgi:Domain of unknown function DUF29
MSTDLYNEDFVLWSDRQAQLLRRVAGGEQVNDRVDWTNIIEEIEGLARHARNDLRSRILTVLDHLLRLQASPTHDPRRSWQRTVVVQRDAIDQLLEENPSLRPSVPATITKALPKAREIAALALAEYAETPAVPLDQLSYTTEQVLCPWMPDDAE